MRFQVKYPSLAVLSALALVGALSGCNQADGAIDQVTEPPAVTAPASSATPQVPISSPAVPVTLTGKISVDGQALDGTPAYLVAGTNANAPSLGDIMVPAAEVADKLGLRYSNTISDDGTQMVDIDNRIRLTTGQKEYQWGDRAPIELPNAPEVNSADGQLYVPLSFFQYDIPGYKVGINNGEVTIETSSDFVVWRVPDNVVALTFADGQVYYPEISGSDSGEVFEVGHESDGQNYTALLRMPLSAEFTADEVQNVELFLKPVSNPLPSEIEITGFSQSWNPSYPPEAAQLEVPDGENYRVTVTQQPDGWVSLDVTDIVQAWLRGDLRNNGFMLSGINGQPVLDVDYSGLNTPYFEVTGQVGNRAENYGAYGFVEQPLEGTLVNPEGGNCLSFALRDTDSILFDDLQMNYDDINRIFTESGDDGVAEYVAQHIEDYVNAHKAALHISNFRRLDSYDSPIDPATEYRIALRVGASQPGGLEMDERGGFDYHLWAQLSDGRWAQKFPQDYSEIIPGTSATVSPEQNYWDSARQYGSPKTQDFYQSKVIYFAATKDGADFTAHRTDN